MKITYNVEAPPKKAFNGGAKSEETIAIEDFLTSGNAKNMCFEYDDDKQAKSKLSTISGHRKKWNDLHTGGMGYEAYRVGKCIYIVKMRLPARERPRKN